MSNTGQHILENSFLIYSTGGKIANRLLGFFSNQIGEEPQVERYRNATEREKQLLEQYKKAHGKSPRYNDRIG
jgi:hypothetical protein